jgi:hypothetical protein
MVIRRFLEISVFALSIGLAFTVVSSAEPVFPSEIEAAGSVEIIEENEVEARENAVFDAVSKALVGYLSEGLGEEVMRGYYSRIDSRVLPRAADLVKNFLVISEDSTEGRFSVLVSVEFNKELVEELLRDSGVPVDGARDARAYRPQAMDSSGARLLSVVFESNAALVDSLPLERYMMEKISGVESVRTARLAGSRVAFEVGFRGDPVVLAGKLATGWAPFAVECTFNGENTINIRQSGY